MNGGNVLKNITWINIDTQFPDEHKDYLVQYNEYIGINTITGWKITKWSGSFPPANRQIITHYTEVPDYIKNYND